MTKEELIGFFVCLGWMIFFYTVNFIVDYLINKNKSKKDLDTSNKDVSNKNGKED